MAKTPAPVTRTPAAPVAPARPVTPLPMLMLPVRIETRFYDRPSKQIRIRIFPDPCAIDAHDPTLAAEEASAGAAFWTAIAASKDEASRLAAWRALCAATGARRAGWVARKTRNGATPAVRKAGTMTKARAGVLPGSWIASGFVSGVKVFQSESTAVNATLAFSVDPADLDPAAAGTKTSSDAAWLFDFDRALRAGMAIQAPLPVAAANGFDELYVIGTPSAANAAAAVESLLEAHLYARGAAFAPQGLPTNNTASVSSGWIPPDDDVDALFAREFPDLVTAAPPGERAVAGALTAAAKPGVPTTNAARAAAALGIGTGVLQRFEFARSAEDAAMGAMNTLLWPVTWGRYFDELLAGPSKRFFSAADVAWIRAFFITHVRGGGTLPALRLGASPFGVAPVALLDGVGDGDARAAALAALIARLRPSWQRAAAGLTRLSDAEAADGTDPGETLLDLLSRTAHPATFEARVMTDKTPGLGFVFDVYRAGVFDPALNPNARRVNDVLGYIAGGSLGRQEHTPSLRHQRSDFEHVRAVLMRFRSGHGSETTVRSPSTQKMLSAADTTAFFASLDLLIGLCEDAMEHLDEHAARIAPFATAGAPAALMKGPMGAGHNDPPLAYTVFAADAASVDSATLVTLDGDAAVTPSTYLAWLARDARQRLGPGPSAGAPPFAVNSRQPLLYRLAREASLLAAGPQLRELASALESLSALGADEVALLLRQSLGLAAWRLDAWASALAARRLQEVRIDRATGVQAAAFGFVERVRPSWSAASVRREGFVHTPSLAHATTAAVLRSGWHARGEGGANDPLAVDLSSARMRDAAWCLDAVRQGADLGDVLGARFERALSSAGLSVWIDPVRRAVITLTGGTPDPVAPVVDGLDLAAVWNHGAGSAALAAAMKFADGTPATGITEIRDALRALDGSVDAMADAVLADATHALVQGNPVRAGASLSAIADGSGAVPELDIVKTPEAGALVRTTVAMAANPGGATVWPPTRSPRALADPDAESIAQTLIGDPKTLRVRIVVAAPDQAPREIPASLADVIVTPGFALGALDVLAMTGGPGDIGSPLHRWITAWALQTLGPSSAAMATMLGADDDDTAADRLAAWRDVLLRARPIETRDLPEGAVASPDAVVERARAALASYRQAIESVEALLPPATEADASPLHDPEPAGLSGVLRALARFGHVDVLAHGLDGSARQRLAWTTVRGGRGRLATASAALEAAAPDRAGDERLRAARRVLTTLFGPAVPGCAAVTPAAPLIGMFVRSKERQAASPLSPRDWLDAIGRARPPLGRLAEALMVDQMTGVPAPATHLAQWPDHAGEPWCAAGVPRDDRQRTSLLLLAPHADWRLDATRRSLSGLVVDEVVDRIPARRRDTGLALEIESPNAEAPQAMLLATCPPGRTWNADLLLETVRDTIDWAKSRGVDGAVLSEFDQHLPAVFADASLGQVKAGTR